MNSDFILITYEYLKPLYNVLSFLLWTLFYVQAVGEPPLFLASSVFFAIKKAISAARKDAGITEWFRFDSPATCARIRMACIDNIVNKVRYFKIINIIGIINTVRLHIKTI